MEDKQQDPNLQAPQESNTTKHINFREVDEADANGNTTSSDTGDDDNPTRKAWEELREDNKRKEQGNS